MTHATTADLVAVAVASGSAVPAFNVITLEHAEAVATGAEAANTPVLLQVSENAVRFHGGRMAPVLAACSEIARQSAVPMAVHLDHFTDPELIATAIDASHRFAVSSIMVDAAHLPYESNTEQTRRVADAAHAAGLWVEAELGEIGGKRGAHASGARTDPAEATDFVGRTGVDALAVAVGSTHAMTSRDADLDLGLTARLAAAVPVPLVLHGGSGVSDDVLHAAVSAGIRKLNVGTALNIAFTGAVRARLAADDAATDPRGYLDPARTAMADRVAELCRVVSGRQEARR
ncbi:class II fructose-bisphosphate aldolase [Mycolicibacterium sp. S2-37]|uniref:class II fructose-bisphosphate aldolase n=1 Tax=Mycolicibacterium sp. S2-37 TaxID=2810297 RepID=UPI001A94FC40|nr:class II fructose-bisphosphate aldolase [Mycolicibacterium sp. S2-37]MBO0681077.1 class II fructose-bisphosphate aldolase [Mycolicibacterium sp. S2-37]